MKHFTVTFKPDNKQISIHAGATLLEAAGLAGIIIDTPCGGKGTCGKCACLIEPAGEKVLACQHHIQSDLTVTVPDTSRFYRHRILAEGAPTAAVIEPDVYKSYRKKGVETALLGLAVDIGTTTVVVKLLDLTTAQTIATETALNPQTRFGDDVVSRIAYAETDDKRAELHNAIIDCLNSLIDKLCRSASAKHIDIHEAAVVGNTTMNHIFLNLPVAQLGQAPYRPYRLKAKDLSPKDIRLNINPDGNVHTAPNIAGFVGADTTAVALATDLDRLDAITLVIDIGTNGEIILAAPDALYAASCAAGPALEGARITCGSRAVDGAIEAVVATDGDIDIDVISGTAPRSICGSGLIDAVALMLDLAVIDPSGRFAEKDTLKDKLPPAILERITVRDQQPAFILAASDPGQPVFLNQRDIRQVQLAKAAIRTGIKLLEKKIGITDADIQQVFLAGAFGNYIRPRSAKRIGLLPDLPLERVHSVGNAACSGAEMLLLSTTARDLAAMLARSIEYVEIAHANNFQDTFADSMFF